MVRYAFPNSRFLMARTGLEDAIQGQSVDIGLAVKEVCVSGEGARGACMCDVVCFSEWVNNCMLRCTRLMSDCIRKFIYL